MKIPQESDISNCIIKFAFVDNSERWYTRYIISEDNLKACANAIMTSFLKGVLNDYEEAPDIAPDIDPNLVKIAELEAKIRVYESVIDSAGIKLGMPKKKQQ